MSESRRVYDEMIRRILGMTDTVTIATAEDGRLIPTFVWSVAVGGRTYVRSAFGGTAKWYRRALRDSWVVLDVDAAPDDTEARPAAELVTPVRLDAALLTDEAGSDSTELDRIDQAYRIKYGHDPANLAPVVSAQARACTLRLTLPA